MIGIRKKYICKLICFLLLIICCLSACQTAVEDTRSDSSLEKNMGNSAVSSESSMVAPESSKMESESSAIEPENSTVAPESAVVESGSSSVSSGIETAISAAASEEMPVQSIPQPDGAPPMISSEESVEEANKGLVYEAGKITITDVKIDGTTRIVDVQDEAAKEQILSYVDGMRISDYTVRNTPPGGGHIIDVTVHRNGVIEQYSFSDQIVDGNTLGKNLQESVMNWTITDKDAYAYLKSFFSAG